MLLFRKREFAALFKHQYSGCPFTMWNWPPIAVYNLHLSQKAYELLKENKRVSFIKLSHLWKCAPSRPQLPHWWKSHSNENHLIEVVQKKWDKEGKFRALCLIQTKPLMMQRIITKRDIGKGRSCFRLVWVIGNIGREKKMS